MKQKTKLIVLMTSFCFVLASCLLSVFAVKNFNLNMAGEIEFIAPGIEATISNATLSGLSKKEDSGQMQEFTITRTMSQSQISDLAGVKSWGGLRLGFDEESQGKATISFTITNNSDKSIENIMVNVSTNTDFDSPIQATPSADFCIAPKANHTFTINLSVPDTSSSVSLTGFKLTVEMNTIKPSEVLSTTEQQTTKGLKFTTNSASKTASFEKYTTPTAGASALADTGLAVEIPAVVKDANENLYTVTEIKDGFSNDYAFYSVKDSLTSLTLPSTLTKIGYYAFSNCSKLAGELKIPQGVVNIQSYAFINCSSLTGSLVIPNSVKNIGNEAFYGCSGLTGDLIIGNGLESIQSRCFYKTGFLGNLTIGKSVASIESSAFSGVKFSGNLVIPDSVTTISSSAFYNCQNFDGQLVLGKRLTTIGPSAFGACSGLTGDLIIPDTVTSIGITAFDNCKSMTGNLVLPKNLKTIGERAFYSDNFTGDLIIPDSVETIGESAFSSCRKFNGVLKFGKNLKTIDEDAFMYCSGFTGDLIIPDSVTTFGERAFYGCGKFSGDLKIGNGVTSIGYGTFYDCYSLSGTITLGSSIKTISTYGFFGCRKLVGDLILPEGLTTLGNYAFQSCEKLDGTLSIPSTVTSIGKDAFSYTQFSAIQVDSNNTAYYEKNDCLISVQNKALLKGCNSSVIPQNDGITRIEKTAFYKCKDLTGTLTIPETVTYIGDSAFLGCSKLTGHLILPGSIQTFGIYAFRDCTGFTTLTICDGVKTIGESCFENCNLTGDLIIPDSVETILNYAFINCDFDGILKLSNNLKSIGVHAFTRTKFVGENVIPDSVTTLSQYAMYSCDKFTTLKIGSGVTTISDSAFYGGTSLTSITITATTPPTLGGTSCFDSTNNCPIYVPAASVDAYQTATNWTEYASRIQAIVQGEQINANGVLTTQTDSKYTGVVYQIDTSTGKASIKANSSVPATEIVVVDEVLYNGTKYVVDTISASAFANNTSITKITIPSGITTIEPKAFAGCTSLANIVFENTANWHCSITTDSTYGTALSVTNSATNIANLTTNYCDLYIKSETFTSAITLKIESELPTVDDYNFYVQFTSGMTWAELISHDTLKYGVNSVNNLIGTIVEGRRGPVYSDANFTNATSIPAPVADVTQIVSSSVIDATKTYVFASDMMSGPLGLWART